MKNIKPIYVYGMGIIIAALLFIFLSQKDSTDIAKNSGRITDKQMPNDSIHKGLTGSIQPGKDNVMENIKKHLEMLKNAVAESPNDTLKVREYADFLASAHQLDDALAFYNKILLAFPKRIDILFSVAYIHYTKHEYPEAENYLNKILLYDKENVLAYFNLGMIAASKGDKSKAKEIWSKIIRDYPKSQISEIAKESLNKI